MLKNPKVVLIIEGKEVGPVASVESEIEEINGFSDDWYSPSKKFLTTYTYTIAAPGWELVCHTFISTQHVKQHEIHLNADDILEARLYPVEDAYAAHTMKQILQDAKMHYEVYTESATLFKPEVGSTQAREEQEKVLKLLPDLKKEVTCPVPIDEEDEDDMDDRDDSVWEIVQHLNDTHKWSREQIADWLETLDINITFPIGEENDQVG